MQRKILEIFNTLTHGVYVIGVSDQTRVNGFTASWVMQASFNPLLVVLSINAAHTSYALLEQSGVFTINVLAKNQIEIAQHFGRPATVEKLNSVRWTKKKTGAPIIYDAISYLECEVSHHYPSGDHVLVVGQVIDGAILNPAVEPMNYRETGEMDGSIALFPQRF